MFGTEAIDCDVWYRGHWLWCLVQRPLTDVWYRGHWLYHLCTICPWHKCASNYADILVKYLQTVVSYY